MKEIVDFKTSRYFSGAQILVGLFLIPIATVVWMKSVVGAVLVLIVSLVILTTHYRLRLDMKNKSYHDYLWILGLRHGEKGKFDQIDYLFLKVSKVSQSMHLRAASSTITKHVIDAYIRLTPDNKIHLFTRDSKHDVVVRLKDLAQLLNTRVIDYTVEEPVELKP
jgi:hypothetical protein